MKKSKILTLSLLLGIVGLTTGTAVAISQSAEQEIIPVQAVTNETHANGAGYYGAGQLATVKHGWPFFLYPYTSDFEFQFLAVADYGNFWGDYSVTMLTLKLDVSQEVGQHKVYTLEGSQSGFRLFDDNGTKIAERYGDSQTSLVSSDTNTAGSIFWNRSDINIEVRIPYKTLCGEDYTGTPIIGVAAQSYYANGEGFDWAGYSKYSDEFNDLDDPSTYTRITYNPDGPAETNYTTQSVAPFNFYTNKNLVEHFVDSKLKMSTYTGDGDGSCLGIDGLYAKAKRALLDLGEDCINIFKTDSDFASAKARYETWAAYNGDTGYEYVDDFTHIQSSKNVVSFKNNNAVIAVATISSAIIIASGAILISLNAKKRKHN